MSTYPRELLDLKGCTVYDREGEKIGKVEDFYFDEQSGEPEWIGIGTGIFNTKHILVPVQGYARRGDGIRVPYAKAHVKDAPAIDDDEITEDDEAGLYEFYGLRRAGYQPPAEPYDASQYRAAGTTGTSMQAETQREAMDRRRDTADTASVTRSEEELRVGARPVEAANARLRTQVTTEPVTEEARLRRETAYVEREPVDEAATPGQVGEREVELSLQREEPVVEGAVDTRRRSGDDR